MTYFFAESISLVPDGTVFLHIGIIALMVFVLNRTFFKPINAILARRDQRMSGSGAGSAGDLLQQVEEKTRHYETTLREARTAGYRRIEQERTAATQARQAQIAAVREEVTNSVTKQKAQINQQVAVSQKTLQMDAQRLAADISARILGRRV